MRTQSDESGCNVLYDEQRAGQYVVVACYCVFSHFSVVLIAHD